MLPWIPAICKFKLVVFIIKLVSVVGRLCPGESRMSFYLVSVTWIVRLLWEKCVNPHQLMFDHELFDLKDNMFKI